MHEKVNAKHANAFPRLFQHPDISHKELRRRYDRLRSLYTKADATPAGAEAEEAPAETQADPNVNHQTEVQNGEQNDNDNENTANSDNVDLDDTAILNSVGDLDSDRQEFQTRLDQYNDYLKVYVPPSFFIGGRYLETYSLWTAMQSAADEHDRIVWDAVLDTLGLDSTKFPHLASQLAAWYDLNLKEFRSFIKRFREEAQGAQEDEDGESGDDREDEGEEEEEAEEGVQKPPSGPAPGSARSSKGFLASVRGFLTGGEASGDAPVPESPSKHVRFSGAQPKEDNDDDHADENNGSPTFESRRITRSATLKWSPKKKAKALEPETQDFAFNPEAQPPTDLGGDDNGEKEESAEDDGKDWEVHGTPSKHGRQLRTEERIVAAVPQSLPAPGSAKRKRTAAISLSTSPAKQRKSMRAV